MFSELQSLGQSPVPEDDEDSETVAELREKVGLLKSDIQSLKEHQQ